MPRVDREELINAGAIPFAKVRYFLPVSAVHGGLCHDPAKLDELSL